jgi:pantoate--beta-alanine ligase
MKIFEKINPLTDHIKECKSDRKIIALVPTMGAIHDGHLSLIKEAKKYSDIVIVSIFVNPAQFNNQEDYKKYPKTLESDIQKLSAVAVDILFTPNVKEIYPENFLVKIILDKLTGRLCGKTRPGHFNGVALIITKLFNIITPDLAIFGQKDFQQLQVIKKLTVDLNFNIKIIGMKTIREENGLALSSRNLRLDKKSKKIAPEIYQILTQIKQKLLKNPDVSLKSIINEAKKTLTKSGFGKIDYLEICDEENLQLIKKFDPKIKCRIFIAVYLDQVRLIDNLEL